MYGYMGIAKEKNYVLSVDTVTHREKPWVMNSFTGVRESLLYPEPHDRFGQLPMAKLVAEDKGAPPDLRALRRYCYEHLAQYKAPKGFELVDALPRTKSGKLLRQ